MGVRKHYITFCKPMLGIYEDLVVTYMDREDNGDVKVFFEMTTDDGFADLELDLDGNILLCMGFSDIQIGFMRDFLNRNKDLILQESCGKLGEKCMDKMNNIVEQLNAGNFVSLIPFKYLMNGFDNKLLLIKHNQDEYYSDDIHVELKINKEDKSDFKVYAKNLVKDFDLVKYDSRSDYLIYTYKVKDLKMFEDWLKFIDLNSFEIIVNE